MTIETNIDGFVAICDHGCGAEQPLPFVDSEYEAIQAVGKMSWGVRKYQVIETYCPLCKHKGAIDDG